MTKASYMAMMNFSDRGKSRLISPLTVKKSYRFCHRGDARWAELEDNTWVLYYKYRYYCCSRNQQEEKNARR